MERDPLTLLNAIIYNGKSFQKIQDRNGFEVGPRTRASRKLSSNYSSPRRVVYAARETYIMQNINHSQCQHP